MDMANLFPAAANLPVQIIGRRVRCPHDMFRWERSEARADVTGFVERINAVAAATAAATATVAGVTENLRRASAILWQVARWAELHRPARNDFTVVSAFGRFLATLRSDGHAMLVRTYGRPAEHRTVELPVYLENSFGDANAMEYGPEHELSFCMYLVALFKLRHLTCADEPHVVTLLFNRYLDVVDYLIGAYCLEPSAKFGNSAGLNDYRFLAFLWGSAQLTAEDDAGDGGDRLTPAAAITDQDVAARHRDRYVFMKSMDFVHRRNSRWLTAKGSGDGEEETSGGRPQRPVWWHSYQLWNLTAISRWHRVNECLMSAYRRDVLGRFEVVQHLVFGELLKFTRNTEPPGTSFFDRLPIAVAAPSAEAVRETASAGTMKTTTTSDSRRTVDFVDGGRYYDNDDDDDDDDENAGESEDFEQNADESEDFEQNADESRLYDEALGFE